jgi:hypothetical protein
MFCRSRRLVATTIVLGAMATQIPAADFEVSRVLPGWGRLLDPARDCDVSLDIERGRLKIGIPPTPHVLSAEDPSLPMNAPRVVRRVGGDFTAVVRVLGRLDPGRSKTTYYDPYHGAGLVVWQDSLNYLRLERAVGFINGHPRPYLNYELRAEGRLALSRGVTIEDRSTFLKLRRRGQTFSAWYGHDGQRWVSLERVDANLDNRVEVGVAAVNSSGRKLSAELEQFRVDDSQGSMARDDVSDSGEKTAVRPARIEGDETAP